MLKAFIIKHNITIGILSAVFAVFAYFFPWNTKPDLRFYFQKGFTVISPSQNIDSLSVFFKGQDIVKDNLKLIAERIKIVNKGADIRTGDYGTDSFGIKIINCNIVGVYVPKMGDYHLRKTINPIIGDTNTLYLQKTVFEKDKEVYIDIYLLYPKDKNPDYTPFGKVVGQELIDIFQADDEDSGFTDILVNIFIVILVAIYAVGIPYILYSIYLGIRAWRRKKKLSSFYGHPLKKLSDEQIILIKMYGDLDDKQFIDLLKNFLEYSTFINTFWDVNLAANLVNEWIDKTKKKFIRFRSIDLDIPYLKVHEYLKKANLIIRDENNRPIQLSDEFLAEVKNTLEILNQ